MDEAIKNSLIDLLKKQIITALIKQFPIFSGGFLGWIGGIVIGRLSKFLIEQTVLGIKILSVDHEVNQEVKELETLIKDSKKEGLTDAEKEEILKRFNDASNKLITF